MKPTDNERRQRDELIPKLGLAFETETTAECEARIPFSFVLPDRNLGTTGLQDWNRSTTGTPEHYTVTWQHEPLHLCVEADVKCLADTSAVDYVIRMTNDGHHNTPILADILPLHAEFALDDAEPLVLHHAAGSMCCPDDFLAQTSVVTLWTNMRFTPNGGRSSDGALPFFNLEYADGGLALAVGWTGQWTMQLQRCRDGNFVLQAGMETTHLSLRPGESIRTPRIVLVAWDGEDRSRGHNLMRTVMRDHYIPRIDGKPVLAPIAHNTAAACCMSMAADGPNATEQNQLAAIERCAELGLEMYWLDAYWFPWPWSANVGNWYPRADDFPNGLRSLGDAAHSTGLKFVLWFEPERVRKGTALHKQHPEFLLERDGDDNCLFNLGDPAARSFMIDLLSNRIDEYGVDVYRQDFNFRPLPFWQVADAPDRVGIAEIRHIEGLYAMWTELTQRHPGLIIDNCASGGRRIDLETCSLSIPLWRTDYTDGAYSSSNPGNRRVNAPIADQVQSAGLNLFIPSVHAGAVGRYEPYAFRSAASTGAIIYTDITDTGFPDEMLKKAVAELERLRPYRMGDFYLLTQVSTDPGSWCAQQYDRPEHGDGIALYFCRRNCRCLSHPTGLRNIDANARYQVVISEGYDPDTTIELAGADLVAYDIVAQHRPAAVLLEYKRL